MSDENDGKKLSQEDLDKVQGGYSVWIGGSVKTPQAENITLDNGIKQSSNITLDNGIKRSVFEPNDKN